MRVAMKVPSLGDVFLVSAVTGTAFLVEVGVFVAFGLF